MAGRPDNANSDNFDSGLSMHYYLILLTVRLMQPLHRLWIDGQDTVGPDLISGATASGAQRIRRYV